MSSFIFVRHGESQANASGLIATLDSPLTDKGKDQAHKTGLELKNKGIDTILCSPLTRAKQTAEIIAKELKINPSKIQTVDDLQERLAPGFEGKPKEHPGEWYILTDDPREESRETLIKRMTRALETIKESVGEGNNVLAVGHGASGYYLFEVAKGKTKYSEFDQPTLMVNADYVKVEL